MYKIYFYQKSNGEEPVLDYIRELGCRSDKDSRIKLGKIQQYIEQLSRYGTRIGENVVKHLDGEIWELRPVRDRILFAAWYQNSFVLLHCFLKQTQKTPRREIEQAKRELADMKERMNNHA